MGSETTVTFAVTLRRLMTASGFENAKQLADRVGLSHVAIGNYLNRDRIPDTETLQMLARFFRVSVDDLLSGQIPRGIFGSTVETMNFLALPPEQRRAEFDRTHDLTAIQVEHWKQRAEKAEQELATVMSTLRALVSPEDKKNLPADIARTKSPTNPKAKRARLRDIDTVSIPVFGTIPCGWPQSRVGIALPDRVVRVQRGRFPTGVFGLEVRGDSMNAARPDPIRDGDTVILLSPELREPRDGDVVAALCDGASTLKRLICPPGVACTLRAESDNPDCDHKIVPAHDLTIQGVMIGKL